MKIAGFLGNIYTVSTNSGTVIPHAFRDDPAVLLLIDSATESGVQPTGQNSGWALAFSDEFSSGSLDTLKWSTHYPEQPRWAATVPGGWYTNTNEPQAYVDEGVTISDSNLVFTMERGEVVTGLPLTSGMVQSQKSFSFLYGYAEARMKLSTLGRGFPAFWLMPEDGTWPPEIDIMEQFNGSATSISLTNYSEPTVDSNHQTTEYLTTPGEWHTYGVNWSNGSVTYYVDGVVAASYTGTQVSKRSMYLILNFAHDRMDPSLFTSGTADTPLPQSVLTDYVRVWKPSA